MREYGGLSRCRTHQQEKLMKTRSELKGLLKRRKMLSSLVTGEKRWIEIMGEVGELVRVLVAIVQSPPPPSGLLSRVLTSQETAECIL